MGSEADATPPPALILIDSAPSRISSRTALRTSVTPSATRQVPLITWTQGQKSTRSARFRPSPWPPVWLADGAPADEQPGADDQSLLDRLLVAQIGAGGVADGGEAAHQDAAQAIARVRVHERWQHCPIGRVVSAGKDVQVAID